MSSTPTRITTGTVVKVLGINQVQIKYTKPDKKVVIVGVVKNAHNMKLNEAIDVTVKNTAPYAFIAIAKKVAPVPPPVPKPPVPKPPVPPPVPKPPVPPVGTIPSTLDLNTLYTGVGPWNLTKIKMLKSTITTLGKDTVLKCHYDIGSGTSADPGIGGFSFLADPVGMSKDATKLSWEVYYPSGFQFARGGKFGGVGIGYGAASGGNHSSTGASNRIMWQEDGGIIGYIYLPEGVPQKNPDLSSHGFGIGVFKDTFAKSLLYDTWNKIELGTKMNTFVNGVPQGDGEAYVTLNGVKKVITGLNWAGSPELKISQISIGNFFGGPLPSPVEQFCYFKNFKIDKY